MTPRILITPEGDTYAHFDPEEGVSFEHDMHWTDNLPAHVIPCPDEWPVEAWEVAR